MVYERAQDVQAAVTDCQKALDIDARNSKSHFCMGTCLERMGEDEAALAAMSRAIDIEKSTAFFNARAMLHDKLGQFDRCIEDFNKAIALEPANDALLHNRGASCCWSARDAVLLLMAVRQVIASKKTGNSRQQSQILRNPLG